MGLVSGPSPLERVMLAFGNLAKQAAMANMFPLMDESIKECGNSILEMVQERIFGKMEVLTKDPIVKERKMGLVRLLSKIKHNTVVSS